MPFATTKNLVLRAYREADSQRLFELYNDEAVARSAVIDYVVPRTGDKWKQFVDRIHTALLYLIIEVRSDYDEGRAAQLSEEDRWAGRISCRTSAPKNRDAWLGLAIAPRWQGKGFGLEVIQWVVSYAFEQLAMHRVSLGVIGNNERAIKVYKRAGFIEEGRDRQAIWQDGGWHDAVHMGIIDSEYWEKKKVVIGS